MSQCTNGKRAGPITICDKICQLNSLYLLRLVRSHCNVDENDLGDLNA